MFVPVWLILCLLFKPDYSMVTLPNLMTALPGLTLGFAINFLLGATVTSLAFWTTRVYSIHEFYYAMIVLFAGQFVPLTLMPPLVQQIAGYLPFQFFIYFPIQLILGRVASAAILPTYGLGLAWLVVAYLVFRWTWRAGLKRFSAVGA